MVVQEGGDNMSNNSMLCFHIKDIGRLLDAEILHDPIYGDYFIEVRKEDISEFHTRTHSVRIDETFKSLEDARAYVKKLSITGLLGHDLNTVERISLLDCPNGFLRGEPKG